MTDEIDVFNESDAKEVKEEKVETAKVEPKEETEADAKEEATASEQEPVKEESKAEKGLKSGIAAERRKRQAVEAELRELKAKDEVIPDPVTDPAEHTKYVLGKGEEGRQKDRIEMSMSMMSELREDFAEKQSHFMTLVSELDADGNNIVTDYALYDKMAKSSNPAKFAYDHAKKAMDFAEKTDPNYEKALRAKITEEVAKDLSAKYESGDVSATDLSNLTNATTAASNTEKRKVNQPDVIDVFDD